MREITIAGPGKNALSSPLMQHLTEQLRAANGEAIVLTGSGDAYSAGLDLKEVASLDAPGMSLFLARLEALMEALYLYPGPSVAYVNGHAIAGGCLLALFCDYRVAAPNPKTKIGLNEVALGLKFPPRILQMTQRLLSPRQAERVVLDAGLHTPEASLWLGLLDELSPSIDAAREKATKLEALPREAYVFAKRAMRELPPIDAQANQLSQEQIIPSWISPELKKKLLAVLTR